jgi:CelD/BcsL family acetyltransferase involved in cellulose biosynthesis
MMTTLAHPSAATLDQLKSQPIRISRVDDPEGLWPRKAEWNGLVARSETNTIFQTFEWHASWWKTFGVHAQPLLLLAESGDELVGIAPLMVSEQRLLGCKRRVVEFIGAGASDYCDFIADPTRYEVLPLMLSWLLENSHQWDLLQFSDIPNTSSTLSALSGFFNEHRYPADTRLLYEAPTRLFGDPAQDQQLVRKKSLRRHYNYFQRSGQLEFKHCHTAEEIMGYLDLFFEQHIQRRALTDTPSLFLDGQQRAFYREVVQRLAPTGWLLFSVVLFNQTPLAFHFGFEYGNRIIWYKPAFNVDYADHSPGEVLIKYLLEYALDQGVAEFDFTIGEEAFKYRFANHRRLNYAVRVFRQLTLFHAHRVWFDTKALVKRSPTLARLGRHALRRWQDLRW